MYSLLQPISKFFYQILEFLNGIGLPWAFAIIGLTVIVRIALMPLTIKQFTSMRAMQRLQPKMKELQAKYKDDKAKLNEEMMKFYRENKVNPFGSCLPLLLQMPIFFALFAMLKDSTTYPLPGNDSFFWVSNITQPDVILVLLYMASQFASSMLMSTTVDKSQRMMMMLMPLGIGVIFLFSSFPAGVLIYWVTTNVWTVGQQLLVLRIVKAREEEPAPAGTAAITEPAIRRTGGKDVEKPKPKSKSKKKRR